MKISSTVHKMIIVMLITALIMIIAGAIVSAFYPVILSIFSFSLGVLLTTCLNIVKVVWLDRVVQRAVDMDDSATAGNYIRFQYLFRFLLTGLVFIFAIIVPVIDLWGALVGIFTFNVAKYALIFIIKKEDENTVVLQQSHKE